MIDERYYLYAFESPHAAIAAERLLRPLGAVVMPTLRAVTANCGMSLRIRTEDGARAAELLGASTIRPALYRRYLVTHSGSEPVCEEA